MSAVSTAEAWPLATGRKALATERAFRVEVIPALLRGGLLGRRS